MSASSPLRILEREGDATVADAFAESRRTSGEAFVGECAGGTVVVNKDLDAASCMRVASSSTIPAAVGEQPTCSSSLFMQPMERGDMYRRLLDVEASLTALERACGGASYIAAPPPVALHSMEKTVAAALLPANAKNVKKQLELLDKKLDDLWLTASRSRQTRGAADPEVVERAAAMLPCFVQADAAVAALTANLDAARRRHTEWNGVKSAWEALGSLTEITTSDCAALDALELSVTELERSVSQNKEGIRKQLERLSLVVKLSA